LRKTFGLVQGIFIFILDRTSDLVMDAILHISRLLVLDFRKENLRAGPVPNWIQIYLTYT
jgi:hypothetical protein